MRGVGERWVTLALTHHTTPFPPPPRAQLLAGLHAASQELLAEWEAPPFRARFSGKHAGKADARIEFSRGDATALNWGPSATFLFVNSTCFTEPLMEKIAAIADRMPVGSFCVTLTRRLPSALWQLREAETYSMTWGKATVLVHEKLFRCGPAQLVGTAPPLAELAPGGPLRPAGKVFGIGGASYTSTKIAINLSRVNRLKWENFNGGIGLDEEGGGGGGQEGSDGGGGGGGSGGGGGGGGGGDFVH